MKLVQGKYSEALVFTNLVDDNALQQIKAITDQPFAEGAHLRFMPDVHAGNGCPVGLTMKYSGERICPNMIGTDIGCGVYAVRITEHTFGHRFSPSELDFEKLNAVIRSEVPSGNNVRKTLPKARCIYDIAHKLANMHCSPAVDLQYAFLSVGTLGSGNHFIEVDTDDEGSTYWLVIHSGSRNLGARVNKYYQNLAVRNCVKIDRTEFIQQMKANGREKEIQTELEKLPKRVTPKEMSYLDGNLAHNYIMDARVCEEYASLNRKLIAETIVNAMGWSVYTSEEIDTKHNYIDSRDNVIRKGAVAACKGEKLVIPMNMRDGTIICEGKGNLEWNCSAPHGAGRVMSHTEAKKELSLNDFKEAMAGVYSTSVVKETLDEAPDAYKPAETIMENIENTVTIITRLHPVYNFKGY